MSTDSVKYIGSREIISSAIVTRTALRYQSILQPNTADLSSTSIQSQYNDSMSMFKIWNLCQIIGEYSKFTQIVITIKHFLYDI